MFSSPSITPRTVINSPSAMFPASSASSSDFFAAFRKAIAQEITLDDFQVEHTERIFQTFLRSFGKPEDPTQFKYVIDASPTGHGKTITAIKLIHMLNKYYEEEYTSRGLIFKPYKAFVVCPATLSEMWAANLKKYGVELVPTGVPKNRSPTFTIEMLRGNNNSISHPYLANKTLAEKNWDINHPTESDSTKLKVTPAFEELVRNNNIFFIFDEFDYAKNKSRNRDALVVMAKYVMSDARITSRGLYLSATPLDKQSLHISLYKLLGLIHRTSYYYYDLATQTSTLTGILNLIFYCNEVNLPLSNEIYMAWSQRYTTVNKASMNVLADTLFNKVLRKLLISNMPRQEFGYITIGASGERIFNKINQYRYNYYFNVPIALRRPLDTAIKRLTGVVEESLRKQNNPEFAALTEKDQKKERGAHLKIVISELVRINRFKLPIVLYESLRVLAHADTKVVIYINYIKHTFDWLMKKFSDFGFDVAGINGQIPGKRRGQEIERFTRQNGTCRVMIAHYEVGGRGIELGSKYELGAGGYVPYTFILPNYNFNDLTQLPGRTYRNKVKTDSVVMLVYGDDRQVSKEQSILESYYSKGKIVSSFIKYGEAVELPDNYLIEYEYPNVEDFPTDDNDYSRLLDISYDFTS